MKQASEGGTLQRARSRVATVRFAVLVGAVSFAIVVVMLAGPLVHRRIPLQVVITLPLVAGVYVVAGNLRYAVGVAVAVAISAALSTFAILHQNHRLLLLDLGLRSAVIGLLMGWAGGEVLREEEVSLDTVLGGVCIYLLAGYFFAHLFLLILIADPSALAAGGSRLHMVMTGPHPLESIPAVLYFSFTTLTTIGFGDLTPVSGVARLVAMIEGIIGQLFPAIFIARLVSLYVARGRVRGGRG